MDVEGAGSKEAAYGWAEVAGVAGLRQAVALVEGSAAEAVVEHSLAADALVEGQAEQGG